jgi:hypothetical protein
MGNVQFNGSKVLFTDAGVVAMGSSCCCECLGSHHWVADSVPDYYPSISDGDSFATWYDDIGSADLDIQSAGHMLWLENQWNGHDVVKIDERTSAEYTAAASCEFTAGVTMYVVFKNNKWRGQVKFELDDFTDSTFGPGIDRRSDFFLEAQIGDASTRINTDGSEYYKIAVGFTFDPDTERLYSSAAWSNSPRGTDTASDTNTESQPLLAKTIRIYLDQPNDDCNVYIAEWEVIDGTVHSDATVDSNVAALATKYGF